MYHCPVTFYLVGLPDEIARIIEDAQPQPSFTHHFTRSDEPEEALTAKPPQPSRSSSPTIR